MMGKNDFNELARAGKLGTLKRTKLEPLPIEPLPPENVAPEAVAGSKDNWLDKPELWEPIKRDWLDKAPPPRDYLLYAKKPSDPTESTGMLPRGRVGALVAAGGVGKSWALVQMAVSVATGQDWLGTYPVGTPGECKPAGNVLLLLAEEEKDEVWRRIHRVANHLQEGVTFDDNMSNNKGIFIAIEQHLYAIAGAGKDHRLVDKNGEPTDFAKALEVGLNRIGNWALIVLDPASRFASSEAETDNAAATAFVGALERLTHVDGKPTVIIAHHTNKASRGGGLGAATDARGVTALVDGIRWAASLAPDKDEKDEMAGLRWNDEVVFRVTKTNYGVYPSPLNLKRGEGGLLIPLGENKPGPGNGAGLKFEKQGRKA